MPAATRSQTPSAQGILAAELSAIRDWVQDRSGLPCQIGPADDRADSYIQLSTVRLVAGVHNSDPVAARVDAHVLVLAHGPDHAAAADAAAALMVQALVERSWELLAGQPDPELWRSLGLPPAPAFMITVPVRLPLHRAVAPPVRRPLNLRGGGLRQVQGRVLAADGTPLSGAVIRLHPDGQPVTTTHNGRWTLSLPSGPVHLDVTAKGLSARHDLAEQSGADRQDVDIVIDVLGAADHQAEPADQDTPAHPETPADQERGN
ncbi:hypothetical protein GCM10009841_06610 [Microlunatus panaciterrae]|uniref:Carboxypeptidase regulatory-like domain-containing protein n=1 Tax=Microlunatus panaciterrae TaxID=400768 RepID=A0ABS2RI61_9ACTN|nr:carboxypeptidase-like regulatory domain-containing protein [Microlunatus panaciterrae]MBM7798685.1 hypothetical protein [Microlunatus panaciterrae]